MKRLSWIVGLAITSASLAASVPQAPPPPPAPTGLIVGEVVDVLSGKPIPEATVTVNVRSGAARGAPAGRAGGPAAGQPVRLLTGADGKFVLHDLPKGFVNIQAIASGYVQGTVGQARPTGSARPIDLDEGEKLTDVKIKLWKHAVVTGTVLDESGEPAVGVSVRMLRQSMVNGKPQYQPGAQARTDDRGIYRISAITPGTFLMVVPQTLMTMPTATVDAMMQTMAGSMPAMGGGMMELMNASAAAPNGMGPARRIGDVIVSPSSGALPVMAGDRVAVYQTLFYPGGATSAQGGAIALGSGDERSGIDFQLRVLPAAKVSGVVSSGGAPVGGVQVRLIPTGGLDFSSDNGIETATTQAAGDGTFQLLGVPSGQYTLSAYKPASPPMPAAMANNPFMQLGGMSPGGQPVPLFAQSTISISNTDLAGVTLAMAEGMKLSGRVEFLGSIAVPTAAQLRAMNVTLSSVDGRPVTTGGGFGTPTPAVSEDLQFKTQGYPPGRYTVTTTGAPQWTLKSVTIGGRDTLDEGFELKTGDITDAVITYTDRVTNLTGNVRTASGTPAKTATVMIFPADYQAWVTSGMSARRSRTAVGTKTGTFTAMGLPPGDYLIAALEDSAVEDPRDPAFVAAVARVARPLTLSEGDRKTQDLQIVSAVRR